VVYTVDDGVRGRVVAEGLNSKIATVQKRACGYRNPNHFKIAVYFHCGGLNLYPAPVTHTESDES
jgi:transposase